MTLWFCAKSRCTLRFIGWRLAFLTGATIGLVIVLMRMWIPESPRWLVTHGFAQAAEDVVSGIEAQFARAAKLPGGEGKPDGPDGMLLAIAHYRDDRARREVGRLAGD